MLPLLLKKSIRTALKNKAYTLVNIIGLALGLSSFIMIMMWVHHEITFDSHNPNADRIYQLKIGRAHV